MKAAYFMQHGGPEVMLYGDVADPVAGPGQVLIDVHAASVNGAGIAEHQSRACILAEQMPAARRKQMQAVTSMGQHFAHAAAKEIFDQFAKALADVLRRRRIASRRRVVILVYVIVFQPCKRAGWSF